MKCPKCGSKMLKFPPWDSERKIMEYLLCYDCCHRIIEKCKWMSEATIGSPLNWKWEVCKADWCTKIECFCNPSSSPEGYIFCPQIREWQEKDDDFLKAKHREFEKKMREKKKAHLEKCLKIYERTQRVK